MNLTEERLTILRNAAEQRQREVMHYQINIDNYRLAIAKIDADHADNADMIAFGEQLRELLASSLREQAKERLLLTVIEKQLTQESA